MGIGDRLRGIFKTATGPLHPDGLDELHIGDPRYDDWDVVRDFTDLEAARAWRQQLAETSGIDGVLTSDWPLDEWGKGDIALRVPPGSWSDAEAALDEPA